MINYLLLFASLLLSCGYSNIQSSNINLGNGYWLISGPDGADIVHTTDGDNLDEGIQVVPRIVTQYAWNDSLIVAVTSSFKKRKKYWAVNKKHLFQVDEIKLDTLEDGQIVNVNGPIIGPMDSLSFFELLNAHNLRLYP